MKVVQLWWSGGDWTTGWIVVRIRACMFLLVAGAWKWWIRLCIQEFCSMSWVKFFCFWFLRTYFCTEEFKGKTVTGQEIEGVHIFGGQTPVKRLDFLLTGVWPPKIWISPKLKISIFLEAKLRSKHLKIKSFDRSLASKNMDVFNFLTCTFTK